MSSNLYKAMKAARDAVEADNRRWVLETQIASKKRCIAIREQQNQKWEARTANVNTQIAILKTQVDSKQHLLDYVIPDEWNKVKNARAQLSANIASFEQQRNEWRAKSDVEIALASASCDEAGDRLEAAQHLKKTLNEELKLKKEEYATIVAKMDNMDQVHEAALKEQKDIQTDLVRRIKEIDDKIAKAQTHLDSEMQTFNERKQELQGSIASRQLSFDTFKIDSQREIERLEKVLQETKLAVAKSNEESIDLQASKAKLDQKLPEAQQRSVDLKERVAQQAEIIISKLKHPDIPNVETYMENFTENYKKLEEFATKGLEKVTAEKEMLMKDMEASGPISQEVIDEKIAHNKQLDADIQRIKDKIAENRQMNEEFNAVMATIAEKEQILAQINAEKMETIEAMTKEHEEKKKQLRDEIDKNKSENAKIEEERVQREAAFELEKNKISKTIAQFHEKIDKSKKVMRGGYEVKQKLEQRLKQIPKKVTFASIVTEHGGEDSLMTQSDAAESSVPPKQRRV